MAEVGIEPSVESVGDSYDNALAETISGLYKAEVIHRRGHGGTLKRSNASLWNGSIGSITDALWRPSERYCQPRQKEQYYAILDAPVMAA
ncbi:Mobile element protein [Brucella suis bv. 2]|nr:Mobile element protein [Brucella suis bv. 2]AIB21270.1 Mobile element protein [Brucella suis bv. 2]AIB24625.1 Mobile element protein [Brucella suis bv. 2]AIB28023.1 Mobile element protein [Brucella suis bv. 2]AIB30778.1 Mobile element protein [Brucella suis bv. 2]